MSKQAHKLTLEILENYKKLRNIRSEFLAKKFRPLKVDYPKYKLFDFEHPYFAMDDQTKNIVKSFEQMLKLMMDVEIDGSSIRNELDMMTTLLILKNQNDAVIDRLRKL